MKLSERIQVGPAMVRAAVEPTTFDAEARTVEICWSAGAEVTRYDWERGRFLESLSLEPKHVRLDRLNAGASVLDNHSSWGGVRGILGVVERAWVEKGEGRALIRFSNRAEVEDIVSDVRSGIIRHVSVGYRVHKFEDITEKDGNVKRFRAIDWEPFEVSLVTIPADAGAGVRSADRDSYPCDVLVREESMTQPTFGAGLQDESRNMTTTTPTTPPAAPESTVDVAAIRAEAVRAERARASEIEEHCQAMGFDESETRRLVGLGRSLAEILPEVRAAFVARQTPEDAVEICSRISVGTEDHTLKREAVETALFHRLNPSIAPPAELGELRGRSVSDLMRFLVSSKEGPHAALRIGRDDLIRRSLHTTSDFPQLLESAGRRTLRQAYEVMPTTWEKFCRTGSLTDFRPTNRVQLGDVQTPRKVVEGAALKYGTVGETSETVVLASYGEGVSFSRQAIINDDLSAFARLLASQGQSVARLVEDLAYEQLLAGTVGGSSIYSTSSPDRANYTSGAATALVASTAGIDAIGSLAARMQLQTNDKGNALDIMPRFLIVPVVKQAVAMKLLADVTPTKVEDVNVWRGRLEVISNSRLDANSAAAYYLAADPSTVDTIEIDWLDGNAGPQFLTEECFETRGIKFAVWADVAAKTIDYRGLAKSKGAA